MCGPSDENASAGIESLPHPSEWPSRPVYLAADERVNVDGYGDNKQPLPLNKVIDFETNLFKGRFFLRLRHVKPRDVQDDIENHTAFFDGKKRFYQLVIQGQFKVDNLTFADVVCGAVYERQLKGVPHGIMGKLLKRLIEAASPGMIFDIFDDKQPKILSPLGRCQTMSVDLPGEEPTNFDNISENTILLGNFASKEERKKKLTKLLTASEIRIDMRHMYTFETYDDIVDFGTFHQHVKGGYIADLVLSLDGQSVSD